MTYEDPACAYCPPSVRACREGESAERGPGFCPAKVDPQADFSYDYEDQDFTRVRDCD